MEWVSSGYYVEPHPQNTASLPLCGEEEEEGDIPSLHHREHPRIGSPEDVEKSPPGTGEQDIGAKMLLPPPMSTTILSPSLCEDDDTAATNLA